MRRAKTLYFIYVFGEEHQRWFPVQFTNDRRIARRIIRWAKRTGRDWRFHSHRNY